MTNMSRGFKAPLDSAINIANPFAVEIAITGKEQYDISCFGLGADEKLISDDYFIFFNNPNSPANEIIMSPGTNAAAFTVNLQNIPGSIQKLAFTINIDADARGVMGEIQSCQVKISQNGAVAFQLDLKGSDFQKQKSVIAVEIYKKNVWRVSAVANGFDGGLSDLLKHYGGEEGDSGNNTQPSQQKTAPSQPSAPQPTPPPSPPPQAGPTIPRPVKGDDDYFEPNDSDWI